MFLFGEFSEMGAGSEEGQFGLGYGHKIQVKEPRNPTA